MATDSLFLQKYDAVSYCRFALRFQSVSRDLRAASKFGSCTKPRTICTNLGLIPKSLQNSQTGPKEPELGAIENPGCSPVGPIRTRQNIVDQSGLNRACLDVFGHASAYNNYLGNPYLRSRRLRCPSPPKLVANPLNHVCYSIRQHSYKLE